MVTPLSRVAGLDVIRGNSFAENFVVTLDFGKLSRAAQFRLGVLQNLAAPMARFLTLYCNRLKDAAVVANKTQLMSARRAPHGAPLQFPGICAAATH